MEIWCIITLLSYERGFTMISNTKHVFLRTSIIIVLICILTGGLTTFASNTDTFTNITSGCTLWTFSVGDTPFEWIQRKGDTPQYVVLQLHGGAYTMSLSPTVYRRSAIEFAKRCGVGVLSVDYRVAPKDPYPAALEDALKAYLWLLDQGYKPENIIISGDSAGGGLTLATALYLRDHNMPLPAALITMSAWTDLKQGILASPYIGNGNPEDPYISPIYADFYNLPPILMQYGKGELIANDSINLAAKAIAQGASLRLTEYDGQLHVFQILVPNTAASRNAWTEVEEFIKKIFNI